MPRVRQEVLDGNREEILDACASLYLEKGFGEVTLGDIASRTSLTRTSIYNYFSTKEEIFLSLLEREYRLWNEDLLAIREMEGVDKPSFARLLADGLGKRSMLLRLMSMNHYDLEGNSSLDCLVSFKREYGKSLRLMGECLGRHFPKMSEDDVTSFIYAFFPFMFGIYPYTSVTPKQSKAMEEAGTNYVYMSVGEIVTSFVLSLLP